MPKPKRPALNRAREHRIEQEIVVDAYTSDERAIGWHCHLDDKLSFPFKAKCVMVREISPLKKGEEVEVLGMAPGDDCMKEMFVLVRSPAASSACRSRRSNRSARTRRHARRWRIGDTGSTWGGSSEIGCSPVPNPTDALLRHTKMMDRTALTQWVASPTTRSSRASTSQSFRTRSRTREEFRIRFGGFRKNVERTERACDALTLALRRNQPQGLFIYAITRPDRYDLDDLARGCPVDDPKARHAQAAQSFEIALQRLAGFRFERKPIESCAHFAFDIRV